MVGAPQFEPFEPALVAGRPATAARAPAVAWPLDLVQDARRDTVGFLMRRFEGRAALGELYLPAARRAAHPGFDYRALLRTARNLAAAVGAGYSGPMSVEFLSAEPKPIAERLASDLAFVRRTLAELGVP